MDFTCPEGLESQKRWIVQDITIRINPHSSHQDGDTHLRVFKQEFTNQWVATSIFCTVHGLNHKKYHCRPRNHDDELKDIKKLHRFEVNCRLQISHIIT